MALRMIKLCSTEAVPHIGSAVHYLKENGLWTLAGRLRKLSKKRNFTAHPDVGFLQDLEAGLKGCYKQVEGEDQAKELYTKAAGEGQAEVLYK